MHGALVAAPVRRAGRDCTADGEHVGVVSREMMRAVPDEATRCLRLKSALAYHGFLLGEDRRAPAALRREGVADAGRRGQWGTSALASQVPAAGRGTGPRVRSSLPRVCCRRLVRRGH